MKEIDGILDPILATFRDRLSTTLQGHSAMAYLRGSAEMVSWGRTKLRDLPILFEQAPIQQAINYANKHSAQLVTRMDEETKSRLAKVIGDAIENKRGIPGLARDIRREFDDMTKFRSQLIARTETADSLSEAFMDRSKAMGVTGKEVVTAPEGDYPCEICQANADEGTVPIDHIFPSGHTRPPFHPACLLPDVRVEAPLTISGSRAFYNGDAIELTTEDGNRLPITPNHPILTPMGFIKAKALREGDYVIDCLDSKRVVFSIDPYYDQSPAFIEDIWDSLVMKQSMVQTIMPTAPIDFHGDAGFFYGDVHIVSPDSFLVDYIYNSFGSEHIDHYSLYGRYTKPFNFSSLCYSLPFRHGDSSSFDSLMGFSSDSFPLCRRQFTHSYKTCLTTIPGYNTSIKQSSSDNTPIYTELSRQFQFRFASLVAPKQIIKVRNFNYSGHVFDLQSLEQLYIANNIIVKNCRCALAPVMLE